MREGGRGNEWKFYTDEVKECAALVGSALIGALTQRCVGDGASVAKQHVRKRGGGGSEGRFHSPVAVSCIFSRFRFFFFP